MTRVVLTDLSPKTTHPTGSVIGAEHAEQLRAICRSANPEEPLVIDFQGVEAVSSSYLKQVLNFFITEKSELEGSFSEQPLILINLDTEDVVLDVEAFLTSRARVAIVAVESEGGLRHSRLLGNLEGAAAETFKELLKWPQVTAQELYERYPNRTSNQTAWNNRLAQLIDLNIAKRRKEGRFWIYSSALPLKK